MSLSLSSVNAHIFRVLINTLKGLSLTSININLDDSGLHVNTPDCTLSILILCNLDVSFFESYLVSENIKFGICINSISKILSCLKKDDILELNVDINVKSQLDIVFSNSFRKQTFILPLFDLDNEILNVPEFEYDTVYQVKSCLYCDIISDISTIEGNNVEIEMNDVHLVVGSEGEIGKTKIEVDAINRLEFLTLRNSSDWNTNGKNYKCIVDENNNNCKGIYSFKFLEKITKLCSITSYGPIIKMKNSMPLQVKFNILQNSDFTLYIAPKIKD